MDHISSGHARLNRHLEGELELLRKENMELKAMLKKSGISEVKGNEKTTPKNTKRKTNKGATPKT